MTKKQIPPPTDQEVHDRTFAALFAYVANARVGAKSSIVFLQALEYMAENTANIKDETYGASLVIVMSGLVAVAKVGGWSDSLAEYPADYLAGIVAHQISAMLFSSEDTSHLN